MADQEERPVQGRPFPEFAGDMFAAYGSNTGKHAKYLGEYAQNSDLENWGRNVEAYWENAHSDDFKQRSAADKTVASLVADPANALGALVPKLMSAAKGFEKAGQLIPKRMLNAMAAWGIHADGREAFE